MEAYVGCLILLLCSSISAAWVVDRELAHIWELSGEASTLFWHDFHLFWPSGVISGLCGSTLRWIWREGGIQSIPMGDRALQCRK